ncbi:MAG TPA: DUF167 domain-containing protein [Gemmatimonadales bacterium]|nr:DUF167 domain-containing protein [Gemmatimonadales bacterium]
MSDRRYAVAAVHVVPRARRTEIAGTYGDAIKIRVAAPPVAGRANAELVRFLAGRLGVPRNAVRITGGERGRRKVVRVEGVSDDELRRALTA